MQAGLFGAVSRVLVANTTVLIAIDETCAASTQTAAFRIAEVAGLNLPNPAYSIHHANSPSYRSLPLFFFYANESGEPRHIHVQRERLLAKFWLKPVSLASSSGFPAQELSKLMGMVESNQQLFVEAWNGFFNS